MRFKRGIFFVLLLLLFVQLVSATSIKDKAINSVALKDLDVPAIFKLTVTNNGPFYNTYSVDTLLDLNISPKRLGGIGPGETKTFVIKVFPGASIKEIQSGKFAFEYFVRGINKDLVKDNLVINLLNFNELVDISLPVAIEPSQDSFDVNLKLNHNMSLDSQVSVYSDLLNNQFNITLSEKSKAITLSLDSFVDKIAGVYKTNFDFTLFNKTVTIPKDLVLKSMVKISVKETTKGNFLSRGITVVKTNEGNSPTDVSITMNKSLISSLFTSFSDAPKIRKQSSSYTYEWSRELNPGESLTVSLRTNYWVPFVILLLLLIAFLMFKVVTTSPIKIVKKVVKVRTKSGVFALKVIMSVKNTGKLVTNVKVIDRIPHFMEVLKDKFGILTPSEMKRRTLIWDFPSLSGGEEVMFSYVVYSKISVVGKLEVPKAVVTFRDNKDNFRETFSEKAFIISGENPKTPDY